jgi:hypothetical protein
LSFGLLTVTTDSYPSSSMVTKQVCVDSLELTKNERKEGHARTIQDTRTGKLNETS